MATAQPQEEIQTLRKEDVVRNVHIENIKEMMMEDGDHSTNGHTETKKDKMDNIECDGGILAIDSEEDCMHVDINEDQWIKCIPKLSLTGATILAAIIGATVGLIIALTGPQTTNQPIYQTITTYYNISLNDAQTQNKTISNIYKVEIINGQHIYFYTETENITNGTIEIPIKQLDDNWKLILEFPGRLWINSLQLLVLPLIILMMIILPSRVDQVGTIGKLSIPLYFCTSIMASIQGTILYVLRSVNM